ncbi:SH3 domain-containing protein [Streptomyces sp. V2]|uniref:SH3 domain-containing protein n=1 Tax=Streptomyces niveiscabiei TaxID=164115 RepID=A0ABW9HK90_9ACTN|nr:MULTISPECIES: hypothetical protein [Streptomyces]PWG13519.1 SH3 domain-containing protein [Streptomyces sp. V2]
MIRNSTSRLTSGGLAFAALAALAIPTAVLGTATPASAACGTSGPDIDNRAYVNQTAGVAANMRTGPSTACGVVGWADNRDLLDYHCYVWTGSTSWTYLRNVTDGTYGWVHDPLLPGYGSIVLC